MTNIDNILSDRTHGSTYIAGEYLNHVINDGFHKSHADKLKETFSDMQIIQTIVEKLTTTGKPRKLAKQLKEGIDSSSTIIANKLRDEIEPSSTLLTFSHSQTVEEVLKKFDDIKIICMQSNPGSEGEMLAHNLDAKVVCDNRGIELIETNDISALLIGCDQYSDEYLVNKVGTAELVGLCNTKDVPVFVLTSHLKEVNVISEEQVSGNDLFEVVPIQKNVKIIVDH